YRKEEESEELRALPGDKIRLERLDRNGCGQLATAILGKLGQNRALVDYLHQQTEGNLFFLVETIRELATRAAELDSVAQHELPVELLTGGIEQLVNRRLEQVPQAGQQLLEIAAVAGRRLDLRLLAELRIEQKLENWLTQCTNAGVLEAQQGEWQ